MIKFEVGKVYKRLDLTVTVFKVCARTDKSLIIKMDYSGKGRNFEDPEFMYAVSVADDVEVIRPIISSEKVWGRADKEFHAKTEEDKEEQEANIEEVKEEDKEEEVQEDSDDWIVGKEYEGICLKTKQRFKAVFVDDDGDDRDSYPLRFKLPFKDRKSDTFNDYGNAAETRFDSDEIIIFKHGIKSTLDWEEVKEERKPVRFEVGKEYKDSNGETWECKAVFDANKDKIIVFYSKNNDLLIDQTIKTLNSVEYATFRGTPYILDFIADEQYRDEIKALL